MPFITHRRRMLVLTSTGLILLLAISLAVVATAVLKPRVDRPASVDAIVVVAGADDNRYSYARQLAETGIGGAILVSVPRTDVAISPAYGRVLAEYCSATTPRSPDGRLVPIVCFEPLVDTTEGEAEAATDLAREQGWDSLLVVTYWGHVTRVRIYFEQCFDGEVYVTDTPQPTKITRRYALTHETGGYVKALLKPAC